MRQWRWFTNRTAMIIRLLLGEGEFSLVYKISWNGQDVALKISKGNETQLFKREIALMR
jgi:predicted Ser/Thr protein kinase